MMVAGVIVFYLFFPIIGSVITIIIAFIAGIYLYLKTEAKWKSTLWVTVSLILGVVGDLLSYVGLLWLYNNSIIENRSGLLYDFLYTLGIFVFTIGMCLAIHWILNKFNIGQVISKKYLPFLAVVSVVIVIAFFANIFILRDMNVEFVEMIGLLMVFGLKTIILIASLFFAIRITREEVESESKKVHLQQLEDYTHLLEEQNKVIVSNQHDYKNILLSVTGYAAESNIQELKDYIQKIVSVESEVDLKEHALNLGNLKILPVKGLLASKINLAKFKNIDIELSIPAIINAWNVEDYDMVRILGIIMDNAIEEQENHNEPKIKIGIFIQDTGHMIVVENKCGEVVHPTKMKQVGFSTKGKGRGLGLSNLNEIMSKSKYLTLQTKVEEGIFIQIVVISNESVGDDND